jgi:hypothetical protein
MATAQVVGILFDWQVEYLETCQANQAWCIRGTEPTLA